jgi:hypothetical protein
VLEHARDIEPDCLSRRCHSSARIAIALAAAASCRLQDVIRNVIPPPPPPLPLPLPLPPPNKDSSKLSMYDSAVLCITTLRAQTHRYTKQSDTEEREQENKQSEVCQGPSGLWNNPQEGSGKAIVGLHSVVFFFPTPRTFLLFLLALLSSSHLLSSISSSIIANNDSFGVARCPCSSCCIGCCPTRQLGHCR